MVKVSVIIPALDEPYLKTLVLYFPKSYEVLVQREKGLSNAVWTGLQRAHYGIVVVMDADGSHPPQVIPELVSMLSSRTWLIIGSRYCNGGYSHDSLIRKLVSLFYCKIAQIFLRTPIQDPMSGFWCGYKDAFRFEPGPSFKFGLQLLRNNRGYVKEYPIVFRKRNSGKSHIRPLQAISDLFAILKMRQ